MSQTFDSLLTKITRYNPRADLSRIRAAYEFARKVHAGQKRLTGETFINHPLAVAHLIADLKLDDDSIIAALLHDVLEEGKGASLEEIETRFGVDAALIVDGLKEIRQTTQELELPEETVQNFRNLIIASVDDIRILIIRLAEKVHNARTLEVLPPDKQKRFAKRIFGLYSPLAEYVGLYIYKRELDDAAFKVLESKDYKWLKSKLEAGKGKRQQSLKKLTDEIVKLLKEKRISYLEVTGRAKGLWSTWGKICRYAQKGNLEKSKPSGVLDKLAVRILICDIPTCYAVLGIIHSHWRYLPECFDDYISRPKPNGYRSLQTTIEWENETAEIQIRTPEMHEYNEFGPASHIAYKVAGGKPVTDMSYAWVRELVSWQEGQESHRFKVKVFEDYVFALTPKGDVIQLKKGSSPIDFAYKVHTDLGHKCGGAKVNNKPVKLDTALKNGDLVEIVVNSKQDKPHLDWLKFVKTAETRRKIRRKLEMTGGSGR